jgi:hypothetical protein
MPLCETAGQDLYNPSSNNLTGVFDTIGSQLNGWLLLKEISEELHLEWTCAYQTEPHADFFLIKEDAERDFYLICLEDTYISRYLSGWDLGKMFVVLDDK